MSRAFQDSIVLFGDSITSQQYVEGSLQGRFCEAYRRTLDILNRGYGGYNTTWARPLFDQIFVKKEDADQASVVRLVTIWFGANDAVLPGIETQQHVPLNTYVANLRYFLELLTSPDSPYAVAHAPGLNIVIVTPPPLLVSMMGDSDFSRQRDPATTHEYGQAALALANEWKAKETPNGNWKIASIDMWSATIAAAGGDGDQLRSYLSDGLHLTTQGYGVFWDEYTKLVRTVFRGRGLDYEDTNDLPFRVPAWEDIDPTDSSSVVNRMKLPAVRQ